MALPVKWTEYAIEDFENVISYLLREWGYKVAEEFAENTHSRIERISIYPEIGIESHKEPFVRSIVLSKQNKLYYRITIQSIEILNIFDTRQNPEKNKYE